MAFKGEKNGSKNIKVYVNPLTGTKAAQDDVKECKDQKLDQCMAQKGYKPLTEKEAKNFRGFEKVWSNPDIDFKTYEAILIDKVDVSEVKVKNMQLPGTKVTDGDIDHLGKEMLERFSKMLNAVMPVIADDTEASGKKALRLTLKLTDIAQTNIGMNSALQVVGNVTHVPIPVNSQGLFCFEGTFTDLSSAEKLITVSDKSKSDKNASLAGLENFEKWKHAYNTMDYWADCLAGLLAVKRGQEYKSKLGLKIISF
ncbi:MAG: DUF3313 family protein [Candidatus Omnitrophica bacterium]|nr:DUF3313 family protein [Candidatus Omnitrophota bacterium]